MEDDRMSLKINTCAICNVEAPCEDDHFPIADRHNGHQMWPLCRTCHDLTDRIPWDRQTASMTWANLFSLFEKADRGERVILAKLFKIAADASFSLKHQSVEPKPQKQNPAPPPPVRRNGPPIDYDNRVLSAIREHGALTRKELARVTHGKTGKVWSAMRRLVDNGTLIVDANGLLSERTPTLDMTGVRS